jgi:nucleoside-diphosphate-sugar epimerase
MSIKAEFILTGYKGDVGQQVCDWLTNYGFKFYPIDEGYPKKTQHYILLHLAAKHPTSTVDEIWSSNIDYMKEVAIKTKAYCKKAVFFSSVSVESITAEVTTECEANQKRNEYLYGLSKCLGETYFKEAFQASLNIRLPAILELINSHNLLSKLYDKFSAHQDVILVNPYAPFNRFIHVNDVMPFIISQLDTNCHSSVDIAVKPDKSLATICQMIRSELNSNSKIIEDNYSDLPLKVIDTSVAESELGFSSSPTLEIVRMWCRQRRESGQLKRSAYEFY